MISIFERVTQRWNSIAIHRKLCIFAIGILPVLLRMAALPFYPIPVPATHDEFSYLLAAETFEKGRLTNPTPPMWEHFETFHELMEPTYMSMYPMGQGAMLALGQLLFGNPWYAVCISVGVMCGALLWMLYEWIPAGWALLGGILAVLQFGVAHYWMNSYWGGSLAGIGGCLVLGSYPRIRSRIRLRDGLTFGIGFGILSTTRPYEGVTLALVVLSAFTLWLLRQPANTRLTTFARVIVPMVAAAAPFVAATMLEAKAITGHALSIPHEFARREVAILPSFAFDKPHPIPKYRHEVLRKFYVEWEPNYEDAREWGTLRGLIPGIRERIRTVGACYFPDKIYLPFALASFLTLWSRSTRLLGICVLAALLGNAAVRWLVPHYFAPILGALMVLHLQLLRWIGARNQKLLALILLLLCGLFGYRYLSRAGNIADWATDRVKIAQQLSADGRNHVIFVRYQPDHILQYEWVFNGPDIPNQRVIWARAMSQAEDHELLTYYKNRVSWVLEADAQPPALQPYTP